MVILPVPSRQVAKASPPDSWVLISSPGGEGEERDAHGAVLHERLADDLAGLVGNLLFERENL